MEASGAALPVKTVCRHAAAAALKDGVCDPGYDRFGSDTAVRMQKHRRLPGDQHHPPPCGRRSPLSWGMTHIS